MTGRGDVGQQAEAEAFCRRIRPRLVGALSLYCGDAGLAEDAAQEALAKVWDRWGQVSRMDSPEGWTFRVAFNASHSRVRRIGRARARERRVASSDVAEPPDVVGALAIRQAVARLPRRQRQALVLRFFEDLSVADTAEVMGCAKGTVKALTNQAVTRLREDAALAPLGTLEVRHGT